MQKTMVESAHGDLALESFLATDPAAGPRPRVMMFPNFFGLAEVDDETAARNVAPGSAAFGGDPSGQGAAGGDRGGARDRAEARGGGGEG